MVILQISWLIKAMSEVSHYNCEGSLDSFVADVNDKLRNERIEEWRARKRAATGSAGPSKEPLQKKKKKISHGIKKKKIMKQ